MRSTILRVVAARRPVAALALSLALPAAASAHEIPSRVTVQVFAQREPAALRLVVRAPLEAMRDIRWPVTSLGYLDLRGASPLAREAAALWIAGSITVLEDGRAIAEPTIVAARVALPDRAFASYRQALAAAGAPPLDPATELPWTQAMLDVVLEYPLAAPTSDVALRPALAHLGQRTTTVLRYGTADGPEQALQFVGDPGVVRLDPRWHHAGVQFVKLGIGHILGGIDHLLFVLCLVIPFRRFRPLVLIVTAFTLAHSITLVSAALGIVPGALWFPPLIETLIAASIVVMALENILGPRLQRRWLVAFGFGLVHGFGFSFALRESLQFAGSQLAVSLVAFNVGVEIGQLAVLAVLVPALSWVLRRVPERAGVIVLSALVAHSAWHWMVERGAVLREYRLTWPAWDLALAASVLRGTLVLLLAAGAAWALAEVVRRWHVEVAAPEPDASGGR